MYRINIPVLCFSHIHYDQTIYQKYYFYSSIESRKHCISILQYNFQLCRIKRFNFY